MYKLKNCLMFIKGSLLIISILLFVYDTKVGNVSGGSFFLICFFC